MTSNRIFKLLPNDPTVGAYFRYKRFLKERPHDRILIESYKVALAKLPKAVSNQHVEVRKSGKKSLIDAAEDLMRYLGM